MRAPLLVFAASGAALLIVLVPSPSRADDSSASAARDVPPASEVFGAKGHLVLANLFGMNVVTAVTGPATAGTVAFTGPIDVETDASSFSSPATATTTATSSSTRVSFYGVAPSIDYFLADRFSIGALVGASYVRMRSPGFAAGAPDVVSTGYGLTFHPRVGYVVPLVDDVAFWPRLGLSLDTTHASDATGAYTASRTQLGADAHLGFVFLMGRHAFLDLGPDLQVMQTHADLLGTSSDTTHVAAAASVTLNVAL